MALSNPFMNEFELQACMFLGSIYFSLNILTMIRWLWRRLYVTIQTLKKRRQMNLCCTYFRGGIFSLFFLVH